MTKTLTELLREADQGQRDLDGWSVTLYSEAADEIELLTDTLRIAWIASEHSELVTDEMREARRRFLAARLSDEPGTQHKEDR